MFRKQGDHIDTVSGFTLKFKGLMTIRSRSFFDVLLKEHTGIIHVFLVTKHSQSSLRNDTGLIYERASRIFPTSHWKKEKKKNSAFCVNSKIHMLQPGSTMKYKTGFDIEMTKEFSEKEKKNIKNMSFQQWV